MSYLVPAILLAYGAYRLFKKRPSGEPIYFTPALWKESGFSRDLEEASRLFGTGKSFVFIHDRVGRIQALYVATRHGQFWNPASILDVLPDQSLPDERGPFSRKRIYRTLMHELYGKLMGISLEKRCKKDGMKIAIDLYPPTTRPESQLAIHVHLTSTHRQLPAAEISDIIEFWKRHDKRVVQVVTIPYLGERDDLMDLDRLIPFNLLTVNLSFTVNDSCSVHDVFTAGTSFRDEGRGKRMKFLLFIGESLFEVEQ